LNAIAINYAHQVVCLLWVNHCHAMFWTAIQAFALIKTFKWLC
jgi:hypothetical protein